MLSSTNDFTWPLVYYTNEVPMLTTIFSIHFAPSFFSSVAIDIDPTKRNVVLQTSMWMSY
jgi:hypothetical protein